MTTPVDRVVAALESAGSNPRPRGDRWEALCPSHDDHVPSLSLATGKDGQALLKCQAGCRTEDVVAVLKLKMADLFVERAKDDRQGEDWREVAAYDYTDETGTLLYQMVRYNNPKRFLPRTPNGHGGWNTKLNGARRVVYRLPEILQAAGTGNRVFVTEGEKDADSIVREGEFATSAPFGAGKWRPEYAEHFAGVGEVVIIADRDESGYPHARDVARSLAPVVGSVLICESRHGKDVTDHLVAGLSLDELAPITSEELEQLCADVPVVADRPAEKGVSIVAPLSGPIPDTRHADILRASVIAGSQLDSLPPPEPLIDGILFRGTLAALYGPSGVGKSFVAMAMAMSVASGSPWQGHDVANGPILYVAAEGSYGLAQRRRAWMEHARLYQVDGDLWLPRAVNLLDPQWAAGLVALAEDVNPHLTVIDTVARSMQGGDENSSRDMGALIGAADALRFATGTTVLLVHHTPRNADNLRGHSSLEGAVDTAIEVRGDEGTFTLRCAKQKDAAEFEDIRLALSVVGGSCVIVPAGTEMDSGITETGVRMLKALAETDLGEGLSPTRWNAVSGVADRSAFRWQKKLVDFGLVGSTGDGKRKLYTLTDQGRETLEP